VIALLPANAHADLLAHDRLRAHVATLDITGRSRDDLDTSRAAFAVTALVPALGTFRLEKRVFGSIRPAGVIGDLLVGGVVPAGLAVGALVADDPDTRAALAWTALGLYATTRIAILVIGNLHISAYRRALDVRFAAAPGGSAVALTW
jgi:hypothetical protein